MRGGFNVIEAVITIVILYFVVGWLIDEIDSDEAKARIEKVKGIVAEDGTSEVIKSDGSFKVKYFKLVKVAKFQRDLIQIDKLMIAELERKLREDCHPDDPFMQPMSGTGY